MADKGEGVNYNDGIIVFCFFFSILGLVIVWVCFAKYYDYKKHLWRKGKYEGASEFSDKKGISIVRFLKTLGGPNFNDEEFDETYCGAAPSKDGQINRRKLPEYFAGDDDAPLVDCCYPCRRVGQLSAPARDACYAALCLNDVSRLAYYEARVAVNSAGNDWNNPSPFHASPCLSTMCDGYRFCAGRCDAARVRCNAVLCENAACECCCGRMARAVEKAGGEWEIDLSKRLPHIAIGMPSGLRLPSTPSAGEPGLLRGGAGEDAGTGATEGAEEVQAADGSAGALTQTLAPEPVTWREESGRGESQAASDEGDSQDGESLKSARVEESDPGKEETTTKTDDIPAGAKD